MKKSAIVLAEVLAVMALFGCGAQKYNVYGAERGYELEKTKYEAGEEVTAYYSFIATDTDYSFYCENEDVEIKTGYDDAHGYIITFTMPAHDVTLGVDSRNSMEYDYNIYEDPGDDNAGDTDVSSNPDEWTCPECGETHNTGGFCASCGSRKPAE